MAIPMTPFGKCNQCGIPVYGVQLCDQCLKEFMDKTQPKAMTPQPPAGEGVCNCEACRPHSVEMRMILCATCGNKRCPHAANHRNACTNSNEPGQPGSSYP